MKNELYILLWLMMFCCCSCSSKAEDAPTTSETNKIEINGSNPVVEQKSGTATITFTTNAAWTASVGTSTSWLSVSPTSGSAGIHTLTVTTQENDTYDERNATVTIKAGNVSKNITVTQKQKDALTITSNKVEIGADGGEFTIEVKTNVSLTYEIEESAKEWISASESRALTTKTLKFQAKSNGQKEHRQGIITLQGGDGLSETVMVYQEGEKPTLVITSNDVIVGSDGETIKIELKSNVDYTMVLPKVNWITKKESRAISTYTHYLTIDPNESYDQRDAMVYVHNETEGLKDSISITQLQLDAIIVAKNEYEIAPEGGQLELKVSSNVDFHVSTSANWIKQNTSTRGLVEKVLNFTIEENKGRKKREGEISITFDNLKQTINIIQDGYETIERKALIAFYKAANGDNWINNKNWCSDKPLNEWYGITTSELGVIKIILCENNLRGILSKELCNLTTLEYVDFSYNELTGKLPNEIGNLNKLERLKLSNNQLSGDLPKELGNLSKLESLALYNNNFEGSIPESLGNLNSLFELHLASNNLKGNIPSSLGKLVNLEYLHLHTNELTGNIPIELTTLPKLKEIYLSHNKLSGEIPAYLSNFLVLEELSLHNNRFTGKIPKDLGNISTLKHLRIGNNLLSEELPKELAKLENLETLQFLNNQLTGCLPEELINLKKLKYLFAGNNKLNGVCSELLSEFIENLNYYHITQQEGYELKLYFYNSTDFSQDGEVIKMQTHSQGNGINIVITFDAFTDKEIADGTVNTYIEKAYDALFSEEPYTTLKEYFDVYAVLTVSARKKIGTTTALGTKYNGDKFSLNYVKVEEYAKKIPKINSDISNTHIIVILNDKSYFRPNCAWTSYGSISCTSVLGELNNTLNMRSTIVHEILGHGIGRLGDEYVEYEGMFPESEKQDIKNLHKLGWFLNVDVTNDKTKVIWKDFLNNSNYAYDANKHNYYDTEIVDIYEGAILYPLGAYRSSYQSIMRSGLGYFNAPSRWAIYMNVLKAAGENPTFESFLEYDKKNLTTPARSINERKELNISIDNIIMGSPPCFINR